MKWEYLLQAHVVSNEDSYGLWLNELGENGWELCYVYSAGGHVFKRPAAEPEQTWSTKEAREIAAARMKGML